jgi:glycosyltransferase involved in cell wall biosynthesis
MNDIKIDLTIAIPIKNEAKLLQGCIDAIGKDFAKHIVIIDSGSTDQSLEIANANNIEVIQFIWNGQFPKKRNWFLQNHKPQTKWVLFLDADEYITDTFKNEIRANLNSSNKVGYWLTYSRYFLGKKLKGGYPLLKLALFQIGAGEYERMHFAVEDDYLFVPAGEGVLDLPGLFAELEKINYSGWIMSEQDKAREPAEEKSGVSMRNIKAALGQGA